MSHPHVNIRTRETNFAAIANSYCVLVVSITGMHSTMHSCSTILQYSNTSYLVHSTGVQVLVLQLCCINLYAYEGRVECTVVLKFHDHCYNSTIGTSTGYSVCCYLTSSLIGGCIARANRHAYGIVSDSVNPIYNSCASCSSECHHVTFTDG